MRSSVVELKGQYLTPFLTRTSLARQPASHASKSSIISRYTNMSARLRYMKRWETNTMMGSGLRFRLYCKQAYLFGVSLECLVKNCEPASQASRLGEWGERKWLACFSHLTNLALPPRHLKPQTREPVRRRDVISFLGETL